ncbi:hypothetical protein BDR26DRAFT_1006054 [Obelidium mucronatum]|nr:hypothetical protein BDR26DRAFT_1006054 [Obelidium mucronatum]
MSGSTIPTNLNLTSECYVSLKSLDEEYVLCTRWQPKETWSSCFCVPQAVQNIYSHCKSPANDLSQWYESYAGSVAQNQKDCAAAGRPNNATLIPPPNLMLTSACYSAMYAWNTAKKGCISASSGVRADELGKNRCICSITNLDEVERQCSSSAENSKNDWFPEYSDNLNLQPQPQNLLDLF